MTSTRDPTASAAPHAAPVDATRRLVLQATLSLPAAGLFGLNAYAAPAPDAAAPRFFDDAERRFVEAATERLIPAGDDGVGARRAAVAFFIDRQLAGPFGRAQSWYMDGPWHAGTDEQGYQLRLTPAELYRVAIREVDAHCRRAYRGAAFAALVPAQQDEVLKGLENGRIRLADAIAKPFFEMLWQNTREGFLADPMYGGNRDFAGWRLIGFPGPRYNYLNEITAYGRPYPLPPVGLLGRDGRLIGDG